MSDGMRDSRHDPPGDHTMTPGGRRDNYQFEDGHGWLQAMMTVGYTWDIGDDHLVRVTEFVLDRRGRPRMVDFELCDKYGWRSTQSCSWAWDEFMWGLVAGAAIVKHGCEHRPDLIEDEG